jgi:KTSC domain
MKPLMMQVKSSNIDSIGHDAKSKTLYIRFLDKDRVQFSGGLYSYYPVSESTFDKLKKAKSKGQWFWKHIKDNKKYTVAKVL